MSTVDHVVGVAYPWRKQDRAVLLARYPHHPIPPVKPRSTLQRCAKCRIPIAVGPLLASSGLTIICALCARDAGIGGF